MHSKQIINGCWTAFLVILTVLSVCANAYEVYNEDDTTSDRVTAEEIFLPVRRERTVLPSGRSASSSNELRRRSHHENISENKKATSRMETPTLKGTVLDPDSVIHEEQSPKTPESSKIPENIPEVHTRHQPAPSIQKDKVMPENVVRGLLFEEEEEEEEEEEGEESIEAAKSLNKAMSEHITQPKEIQTQKKVVRLRKIQNPDLILEQQQRQRQQKQQQPKQEQKDDDETVHHVREFLKFEPTAILEESDSMEADDLLVGEGELWLGPVQPDCPPGSNLWDCLLTAEDLVAVRKDQNLSGASSHHRTKRQSNNENNGNANDEDIAASGEGELLYRTTDEKSVDLTLKNTIVLGNNGRGLNLGSLRKELLEKLEQLYGDVPGFRGLTVDNVTQNPDGTLSADVSLKFDSTPAEYSMLTNNEYLDQLTAELEKVGQALSDLTFDERPVVSQTNATDIGKQAANTLDDPCSTAQCAAGYSQCQVSGNRAVRCEHKCIAFESSQSCEHGSTCELDQDSEPFCACTKRWTGSRCQLPVRDDELDKGEITGVAAGAAILAAGVIGTAVWCLLCRRRTKDPIFTHYMDEEGSERFSNPSSKLSNFVIDRPRISVAPINTFNPNNNNNNNSTNLSRRSSTDNSSQRPFRPRYSNA